MDEDTKSRFKWKFFRLTIELNIILLLVAASVLVFFITHFSYRIPLVGGMLTLALVVSLDFTGRYKATKAWLDENGDNSKDRERH